jgi:hypothetical protein
MGSTFYWFTGLIGLIGSTGLIGFTGSTGCIGFIRSCVFLLGSS